MTTTTTESTIERVAASTLKPGDMIGTTRTDSRKTLEGDAGHKIAQITEGPGGRIQARDSEGKVIRSFSPETEAWVRHDAPAEPAAPAAEPAAAAAEEPQALRTPAPKEGEQTCRVCERSLPLTKFPTKAAGEDGIVSRDDRCRECRDKARDERKAAKAKEEAKAARAAAKEAKDAGEQAAA
jgi:hypothetical protein